MTVRSTMYPNSGLMFLAAEDTRLLCPWTSKLRAYMHGYFVNVQLYSRAKQQRSSRTRRLEKILKVKLKKLPNVNRETAVRLRTENESGKAKKDIESNNNQHVDSPSPDEKEEVESTDSEGANEIKQLKKLARKSAKINRKKFSHIDKSNANRQKAPVSKLDQLEERRSSLGSDKARKVEMIAASNVADCDFVVPVRSKMSLKNLNSESSALSDRLAENETLSKQVDIGLNRGQSASFTMPTKKKKSQKSKGRRK